MSGCYMERPALHRTYYPKRNEELPLVIAAAFALLWPDVPVASRTEGVVHWTALDQFPCGGDEFGCALEGLRIS
jgi:hypothetical protein